MASISFTKQVFEFKTLCDYIQALIIKPTSQIFSHEN